MKITKGTPVPTKQDRMDAEIDELELGDHFDDSYAQGLANARARVERRRMATIARNNRAIAKTLADNPLMAQQDLSGGEVSRGFSKGDEA